MVMCISMNAYTVGHVGCKRRRAAISHVHTKLWNCCQRRPVSLLPNKQRNLHKDRHEDEIQISKYVQLGYSVFKW